MARLGLCVAMLACVVLALPGCARAATAMGKSQEKPKGMEHLVGCYNDVTHTVLPVGNWTSPMDGKNCLNLYCGGDNGDITYHTCGSVSTSPPCRVVAGDLHAGYPGCCPKVSCD